MDIPYASSSRSTQQHQQDDTISGSSSAERSGESAGYDMADGSWRPPAKRPSSLQSRYATSQWASAGKMVDISARSPAGSHYNDASAGRGRYKRDGERHRNDFDDPYRKTLANMLGYEVTSSSRSLLTHPTSDLRSVPPASAQSTVASSGTASSPRDSFSFRSSRDLESVPTTPEQHSSSYHGRSYHHPHSDDEEEETLISATKLMRVQSFTSRGATPRMQYEYRQNSLRDIPPPPRMRTTRSGSPPRASGSSHSHSSGVDEDEDRSSRHYMPPPPHSAPVGSPTVSSRVSSWVGDVDRQTPQQTVLSPPPIAHMAAPSFEPRPSGNSFTEFRRPPYLQQSSFASTTKSSAPDDEDFPIEEETDELEESGDELGSEGDPDGDAESSARPSLKRGNSSGYGNASTERERGGGGGGNSTKNLKNNGIHYCPHCVASFRRNFDMNRHIASIHAERTDLTCPGCPSRSRPFSRRDALRRHLKSVINQNPTPRRRICNLTPAEASSLMEKLSK